MAITKKSLLGKSSSKSTKSATTSAKTPAPSKIVSPRLVAMKTARVVNARTAL